MGFCIPSTLVYDTLEKARKAKQSEIDEMISNHRVKAVYSVVELSSKIYITVMAVYSSQGNGLPKSTKVKDIPLPGDFKGQINMALKKINKDLQADIEKHYEEIMKDKNTLSDNLREQMKEFWEKLRSTERER